MILSIYETTEPQNQINTSGTSDPTLNTAVGL